jgi:NAD(P)-dependent dehydrogenase (short-subunit alcohol dehydrogenase family)
MASHAGRVYIITGAASGMGLAATRLLLGRGAKLGLCDINTSSLEEYINSLSGDEKQRVHYEAVSVTNDEAIRSFMDGTKKKFGKLDGIANFAGTGGHRLGQQLITDTDDKEYDFIMDLNVRALFYILRCALKPGVLEESGSIVHITSMYAQRGFQNGAVFTASKHAANGMVQSAAMEVAERGIRVNTVMP